MTDLEKIEDLHEYAKALPYQVLKKELYSAEDLYEGYDPDDENSCNNYRDALIYRHYTQTGKQPSLTEESLCRSLHDHWMHASLRKFFTLHDCHKCVGIMGGHANSRTDAIYKEIVLLSKELTEKGFLMITGGGPGAMEATHLGAWMASRTKKEVDDALDIMSAAPTFKDRGWLSTAWEVRMKYPQNKYVSLSLPTWLYGHEPSTVFPTHIAKFFENSIREDSILTYAFGGIIYTPGSAGTLQEVFQDAVQNHYLSFGFSSPMIFFGKRFWKDEVPLFPLLEQLVEKGTYRNMIMCLTDSRKEVISKLTGFQHRFIEK